MSFSFPLSRSLVPLPLSLVLSPPRETNKLTDLGPREEQRRVVRRLQRPRQLLRLGHKRGLSAEVVSGQQASEDPDGRLEDREAALPVAGGPEGQGANDPVFGAVELLAEAHDPEGVEGVDERGLEKFLNFWEFFMFREGKSREFFVSIPGSKLEGRLSSLPEDRFQGNRSILWLKK